MKFGMEYSILLVQYVSIWSLQWWQLLTDIRMPLLIICARISTLVNILAEYLSATQLCLWNIDVYFNCGMDGHNFFRQMFWIVFFFFAIISIWQSNVTEYNYYFWFMVGIIVSVDVVYVTGVFIVFFIRICGESIC